LTSISKPTINTRKSTYSKGQQSKIEDKNDFKSESERI
jgi:hypothetical protein